VKGRPNRAEMGLGRSAQAGRPSPLQGSVRPPFSCTRRSFNPKLLEAPPFARQRAICPRDHPQSREKRREIVREKDRSTRRKHHYVKTSNRSCSICNGPLTPVTSTHICNSYYLASVTYKCTRTTPGLASCHTCFSKENQVQTYMHTRIKFHAYSDI
jgi:hypothetical protein